MTERKEGREKGEVKYHKLGSKLANLNFISGQLYQQHILSVYILTGPLLVTVRRARPVFQHLATSPTYWFSNIFNIYHDIKISRLYINNVLWEINCTSLKHVNMLASNILSATTLQIHTVQICRLVNAAD